MERAERRESSHDAGPDKPLERLSMDRLDLDRSQFLQRSTFVLGAVLATAFPATGARAQHVALDAGLGYRTLFQHSGDLRTTWGASEATASALVQALPAFPLSAGLGASYDSVDTSDLPDKTTAHYVKVGPMLAVTKFLTPAVAFTAQLRYHAWERLNAESEFDAPADASASPSSSTSANVIAAKTDPSADKWHTELQATGQGYQAGVGLQYLIASTGARLTAMIDWSEDDYKVDYFKIEDWKIPGGGAGLHILSRALVAGVGFDL
jgi:hypothetical protein